MELVITLIALVVACFGGWAAKTQHGKTKQLKAKAARDKCKADAEHTAQEASNAIDNDYPDDPAARLVAKARYVLGRPGDPDAGGGTDD